MPLKQKKEILPEQVYPKPLMGNQTDSLKNYLDVERERRRNQGKE
jgi:hypothetical protein